MMSAIPVSPVKRKQILRVIFISLLLDLVSSYLHYEKSLLTFSDIVYIHPSPLSKAARILPQTRGSR